MIIILSNSPLQYAPRVLIETNHFQFDSWWTDFFEILILSGFNEKESFHFKTTILNPLFQFL